MPASAHVLDLGRGSGHRVMDPGERFIVTASDISFVQTRRARERLPHARMLQADMTRLAFAPSSSDAATSPYAFNHRRFGELPRCCTGSPAGELPTLWETINHQTRPTRFFWVTAQRTDQF